MIYNSLVGANLIKSMQEKDLLRYPINFFRTLRINLTGFYMNMQVYLLAIYDIGFRKSQLF